MKNNNYEDFHEKTSFQKKIIEDNNFTYRHILKILNIFIKPPKEVLDVGCGAGTICLYLGGKGNNVLGIDISEKAINAATKSAELLQLKNTSFKRVNFPKEAPRGIYDFIICSEVIEHIHDDKLALKKMFNLLKKGGILFISTPSINAPLYKLGLTTAFDRRVGHLRRYTVEELVKKSSHTGFNILGTEKTEGIIRNFLFLNPAAGKFVRFIKFFLSDLVTYFDNISLKFFGESNIFIILQKPNYQ